jgi:hypothetical protein
MGSALDARKSDGDSHNYLTAESLNAHPILSFVSVMERSDSPSAIQAVLRVFCC